MKIPITTQKNKTICNQLFLQTDNSQPKLNASYYLALAAILDEWVSEEDNEDYKDL